MWQKHNRHKQQQLTTGNYADVDNTWNFDGDPANYHRSANAKRRSM